MTDDSTNTQAGIDEEKNENLLKGLYEAVGLYDCETVGTDIEEDGFPADTADLDDLLSESLEIVKARIVLKKRGGTLSQAQCLEMARAGLTFELGLWETRQNYAHVKRIVCACGESSEEFCGFYSYQERKDGSRKLSREGEAPKNYSIHLTVEPASICCKCVFTAEGLTPHTPCDLLEALTPKACAQ